MRIFRRPLLYLLLLGIAVRTARADSADESALSEAADWLRGNLATHAKLFGNRGKEDPLIVGTTNPHFEACTLLFRQSTARKINDDFQAQGDDVRVSLADLDPNGIRVEEYRFRGDLVGWTVVLMATNAREVFSIHRTQCSLDTKNCAPDKDFRLGAYGIAFGAKREDIARRSVRAFSAAIAACGGKRSSF